jgi:ubiquinol-cytochrome c reductase cytochrome c1 subunit
VLHTADEMKEMAEEHEYDTEPNDEGEIEKRPGKLSDYIPKPYKNDEAARAANNGALPPDLSLMVKARHGGCNYIFSLLTGYPDEPPAGATVQAGLNFNPYFPGTGETPSPISLRLSMLMAGTGIAMARVLYDGLVEYEDGTPASTSQMAKDVVEFLNWAAEPEMDERKRMGMKAIIISSALFALSVWVKRYVFPLSRCQYSRIDADHVKQIQMVSDQDQEVDLQSSRESTLSKPEYPQSDPGKEMKEFGGDEGGCRCIKEPRLCH